MVGTEDALDPGRYTDLDTSRTASLHKLGLSMSGDDNDRWLSWAPAYLWVNKSGTIFWGNFSPLDATKDNTHSLPPGTKLEDAILIMMMG